MESALAAGEEQLVIVSHGGTQMAVMERWGQPYGEYYSRCAKVGCGFLLDTARWPEALDLVEEIRFTE